MKKFTLLLIIFLLVGCSKKQEAYSYNMFYMDTYINIKIYDIDNSKKEEISKKIDNIYKEYHELCNRYEEYKGIKNIYYLNNILEENKEIEIDSKLAKLIELGIDNYNDTNGVINIALGNVIDVWKKYREKGTGVPTVEELKKSGSINISDIEINNNKFIKKSDVKIDLGSVAKGYVTGLVGIELEKLGYKKYIINAGGNVLVGQHYDSGQYKIGVENPTDPSKLYKVVNSNNMAVVTSGGYQRYYEYKGKRYHHIIDSNTLFPPNYSLSVTVITKDSGYADTLSTILFLMPINEGIEYVDKLDGVEAIWYDIDNNIHYSKGFSKYE